MDIISEYKEKKEAFDDSFRVGLIEEIESHLEKLDKDEVIPLNSDNCDGKGIMTGDYTDTINKLTADGGCPVYNNTDCDEGFMAHPESAFGEQSVEVLVEILKCVRKYMSERNATIKEDLELAANILDKAQEGMKKVLREDSAITKNLYDLRCKLEDIKEDYNEII